MNNLKKQDGTEFSTEEKELIGGIQSMLDTFKGATATKEDLKAIEKSINEQITKAESFATNETIATLKESLIAQGEKINELLETKSNNVRFGSTAEQLRSFIDANKEAFDDFKARKTNTFNLEIKAAGNMTIAGNVTPDAVNVASTSVVPGYVDILGINPFFDSLCNTGSTDSAIIQYVEKVNRDGSTIFIGEGEVKNKVDFDWKKNTSTAKKVADYIKASDEMLTDISFMAAAIDNELRYLINAKTSSEILLGDGTGDNLKGIATYAQAYTLTTIETTTPTVFDVLQAMATQITTNNGIATHAVLNPIDYTNMGISKGTNGYYVVVNGMVQALPFIVVQHNQMPVGQVLVADMTKAIVRNYKPFTIEYGWENDDFTKNFVTVRGERRVHFYIADNHTPCFVYDAISDVKTAITA